MLFDLLAQQLQGSNLSQISRQLRTDEKTTSSAISAALPILVGALARNSSGTSGARSLAGALQRDHDGSILDNLGSFLKQPEKGPGEGILQHVLGGDRSHVESAVASQSGLDPKMIGQLLKMLAPILMGGLGKVRRESNLGSGGLRDLLQGEQRRARKQASSSGLWSMLDSDGDGSVVDDVAGLLGKFLK